MIDREMLRHSVDALAAARNFEESQRGLNEIAAAIDMSTIAWAPDVSYPGVNPYMDAFLRTQGWPDEVLKLWWRRDIMLKVPLYIRCRFTAQPFVSQPLSSTLSSEVKKIGVLMGEMGLRSMLTVPVRLPRAQVAMVTWCGALPVEEAQNILTQVRSELLLAAYYFCQSFASEMGYAEVEEEEFSRLTPREWECLRLTAQGHREAESAALMNVSPTTVRYHLDNVVHKLGASTRTHAVALAAQLGMLGPISR